MSDDSEDWGPWIEHDGKGCPCIGMPCEIVVLQANGEERDDKPGTVATGGRSWDWIIVFGRPVCRGRFAPIIRYRIRKPRAFRDLIALVENLPSTAPGELERI